MKQLLCNFSIAISVFAAVNAFGAAEDGYFVQGIGFDSCAEYTSAHTRAQNEDREDLAWYLTWVGGYLTSFNSWQDDTWSIVGDTDMLSVMAWLNRYCSENPWDDLDEATRELVLVMYPNRYTKEP